MDSVPTRDDAHPIRWEPNGDPEIGVYITLNEAVIRLANYWGDDQREWLEEQLRSGQMMRTEFAYYIPEWLEQS